MRTCYISPEPCRISPEEGGSWENVVTQRSRERNAPEGIQGLWAKMWTVKGLLRSHACLVVSEGKCRHQRLLKLRHPGYKPENLNESRFQLAPEIQTMSNNNCLSYDSSYTHTHIYTHIHTHAYTHTHPHIEQITKITVCVPQGPKRDSIKHEFS